MKRRRIWRYVLLVTIVALVFFAGGYAIVSIRQANRDEIHHKVEQAEVKSWTGAEEVSILENAVRRNNKKLETYVYPEGELLCDIAPNVNQLGFASDSYWNLATILGHYPTPNIRHMEGSHYYACYMTETGARYYVFFMENTGLPYGYPVYMVKNLSYGAFDGIEVGTAIEKVEEIDPATRIYRENFDTLGEDGPEEVNARVEERYLLSGSYTMTSVHLLTDGFLEIRYEYSEEADIVVKEMHYSENYTGINNVAEVCGDEADDVYKNMPYSYKILEDDFIGSQTAESRTAAK